MNFKKNLSVLGIALVCSGSLATASNVFAASDTSQDTPVKATITVDKIDNPSKLPGEDAGAGTLTPGDDTSSDNTQANKTTGDVAIAYQPKQFTGSGKLGIGSTEQSIPLKVTDTTGQHESTVGHVGVKDQTKKSNGWILNAQFSSTDPELAGSSVSLKNGTVQMNNNGKLEALPNAEVTVNTASPKIGTTAVALMSADNAKVQYGVYDYQFDGMTLDIANPSLVSSGDHTANVNWNLQNTPQP